jgi:hypothetical protein
MERKDRHNRLFLCSKRKHKLYNLEKYGEAGKGCCAGFAEGASHAASNELRDSADLRRPSCIYLGLRWGNSNDVHCTRCTDSVVNGASQSSVRTTTDRTYFPVACILKPPLSFCRLRLHSSCSSYHFHIFHVSPLACLCATKWSTPWSLSTLPQIQTLRDSLNNKHTRKSAETVSFPCNSRALTKCVLGRWEKVFLL